MQSPQQRRSRRSRVERMCFLLLETNNGSMRVADIVNLMDQAFRFRMSVQRLSNIMRPHLSSNAITKTRTPEGNSIWHLAYRPTMETL